KNVGGEAYYVNLDYDALASGDYITARVPLGDWEEYTSAKTIYTFRFYVNGILFNTDGKLIIDYIYMGSPTQTATPDVPQQTRNYLFFGFDEWTDTAYYNNCSLDGSNDYSKVDSWYSDINSCGANGSSKLTLNTAGYGTISFKDPNQTDHINGLQFAGTGPLNYSLTGNDYFKIRFKITGGSGTPGFNLDLRLGTTWNYINKPDYVPALTRGDTWQEITFRLRDRSITTGNLTDMRVWFTNTQGCTFTIDYFALFPASLLTNAKNQLYMDFGTDSAELFFSTENLVSKYGSGKGFENFGYFYPEAKVSLTKTETALVMEDTTPNAGAEEKENDTRVYFEGNQVNFMPGANHYFQACIKIDVASGATAVRATSTDGGRSPRFHFSFKNSAGRGGYVPDADSWLIDLDKDVGKWITVTIPIRHADYNTSNPIIQVVPALIGTQGAKVSIDYMYIGPLRNSGSTSAYDPSVVANPSARSLYFGFDNDQSDKDRYTTSKYRSNDTYCGLNYDAGNNWVTASAYSDSAADFEVRNTDGIVKLNASTKNVGGNTKGPYFVTTKTSGQFVVDAATQGSLNYHPEFAEIFQIRFRLNGCSMALPSDKLPELIFLFGGYDKSGEFVYHEDKSTYPYMTGMYHDTDEFQTVTIELPKTIRNLTKITNFGVRFWRIEGGSIDIDYIYLGPRSDAPALTDTTQQLIYVPTDPVQTDTVYSYDAGYNNDTQMSNGKSMFVLGNGVRVQNDPNPTSYTEASFTFTGTGFDIISRTDSAQGAIRVEVRKAADNTLVRSLSVNNKSETQLHQIPVASINGLAHGNYKVTISVNKKVDSSYDFLKRGNEFYFDAIRIYDTVNLKGGNVNGTNLTEDQKITLNAYRMDKEAFPFVREIRDSLLSATDFAVGKYATSNALYIDTKTLADGNYAPDDVLINPNLALNVATYDKLGPKNEVYLSPGQAVAFKLNWGTGTPVGIDVGAKTVLTSNGKATLAAGFVTSVNLANGKPSAVKTVKEIDTATGLYYPLDISSVPSDSYLVLYNASTGTDRTKNILSLTDLKICYNFEPSNLPAENTGETGYSADPKTATRTTEEVTEPFRYEVDDKVLEATALFLNSFYETPVEEEPMVDESLNIYHSLNLASDISVNFMVPAASLEGYDSFSMRLAVTDYERNDLLGHAILTPEPVLKGEYYYFTLSDLNATRMNDKIEATLTMVKDGKEYVSLTDTYSIADYAYGQLEKTNTSYALKVLCADLLVYGAKAQIYKDYRTDALADEAMTELQRSYCTDLEALTFGNNNLVLEDLENPTVLWKGKSLNLDSRVGIRYIIDTASYEGDPSALSLRLTYVDGTGTEQTVTLTDPALYREGTAWYAFDFYGLLASELRTVVSARVYAGETALSNTLTYSPDTYGNNKTGALGDLCRALFAYSDSAKAFFAN
ncbi:MAG: hypothetical protein IKM59_04585, partial [Oscillospiraceae bacterium]|nr:hypothetical protein [Oscillospiraceae bacterium]